MNSTIRALRFIRNAKRSGYRLHQRQSAKMFNMMWIEEQMDLILSELQQEAKRSPEVASAIDVMEAAKKLLIAYGDRLRSMPNTARSAKNIDGLEQNTKELVAATHISLNDSRGFLTDILTSLRDYNGKYRKLTVDEVMDDINTLDELWQKYWDLYKSMK